MENHGFDNQEELFEDIDMVEDEDNLVEDDEESDEEEEGYESGEDGHVEEVENIEEDNENVDEDGNVGDDGNVQDDDGNVGEDENVQDDDGNDEEDGIVGVDWGVEDNEEDNFEPPQLGLGDLFVIDGDALIEPGNVENDELPNVSLRDRPPIRMVSTLKYNKLEMKYNEKSELLRNLFDASIKSIDRFALHKNQFELTKDKLEKEVEKWYGRAYEFSVEKEQLKERLRRSEEALRRSEREKLDLKKKYEEVSDEEDKPGPSRPPKKPRKE